MLAGSGHCRGDQLEGGAVAAQSVVLLVLDQYYLSTRTLWPTASVDTIADIIIDSPSEHPCGHLVPGPSGTAFMRLALLSKVEDAHEDGVWTAAWSGPEQLLTGIGLGCCTPPVKAQVTSVQILS